MDAQTVTKNKSPSYRPKYKRMGVGRTRSELRNDILNAVCSLLRNGSYQSLSMEDVSAIAATSRRTVYNLFQDKDELYKEACNRMIRNVSDMIIHEIPEQMSIVDGLRYFVASCVEAYGSRPGADVVMIVTRDSVGQPWLAQCYNREIFSRLVIICENFILKKSRRIPMPPAVPGYIGQQIVIAVKSMVIEPWTGGKSAPDPKDLAKRTDVLVKAYASIISANTMKI
jgi:AcrR family transcriptional regulator